MRLKQVTFLKEVKDQAPDYIDLIDNYKSLEGKTMCIVTRKGAVYVFDVTQITKNQLRSDTIMFGENCYLYFNYCEKLEQEKQARFYLVQ